MPDTPPCPGREQLQSLLTGELSAADQDSLTRHVEDCPDCQRTLDGLASDSMDERARGLGRTQPPPDDALRKVVAKALGEEDSDATQAEPSGDRSAEGLDFLAPSSKAGSIGRLAHYEVQELIGRGGFGAVLKAFDEKLQRVVAIKVLSLVLAASATARKRFVREARAAAAVGHEHVVTIHAVEDEANPPYLVMQCILGQSLQEKLDREGPLELREILRIGFQTAEGLAAAHKQGLVHRDIKPANILLENGVERVKITDFGLARAADDASLSQSGVIAGTPLYMSPEQAEGLNVDHRSDLFSLGTVLYAMCTGRSPFRASTTLAVLKRVVDDTPRPIREINPEVPDWLCAIIAKLHAKDPAERYQTAREVADLLAAKLAEVQAHGPAGAPVRAPEPPGGQRGDRPAPPREAAARSGGPASPSSRSSLPSRPPRGGFPRNCPCTCETPARCGSRAKVTTLRRRPGYCPAAARA